MGNYNRQLLRDSLTEREQAILRLLAQGLSDREIAESCS
jgi:DNA-binding NarL/FixJ family response regulator